MFLYFLFRPPSHAPIHYNQWAPAPPATHPSFSETATASRKSEDAYPINYKIKPTHNCLTLPAPSAKTDMFYKTKNALDKHWPAHNPNKASIFLQ